MHGSSAWSCAGNAGLVSPPLCPKPCLSTAACPRRTWSPQDAWSAFHNKGNQPADEFDATGEEAHARLAQVGAGLGWRVVWTGQRRRANCAAGELNWTAPACVPLGQVHSLTLLVHSHKSQPIYRRCWWTALPPTMPQPSWQLWLPIARSRSCRASCRLRPSESCLYLHLLCLLPSRLPVELSCPRQGK